MQPLSSDRSFASAADMAACRALLANGSRTFLAASHLLPWRVSDPAIALYAFCRMADDAIDESDAHTDALAHLNARLDAIYLGAPLNFVVDRAFADVVNQFAIPRALPQALLEGFAWDADGRRYETIADVQAYAARVAGTVGAMMALLMGVRSHDDVARACDLGIAMQLTNIARDVGEDARNGRLYLPRQWLAEDGIDADQFLTQPVFSSALARVIERMLATADEFYRRADMGIAAIPFSCRPSIRAARLLYAEIGHQLRRNGLDSVAQRAYVSRRRRLSLLLRAIAPASVVAAVPAAPAEEAGFLVDAVRAMSAHPALSTRWNASDRMVWLITLFERLDRDGKSTRATVTR